VFSSETRVEVGKPIRQGYAKDSGIAGIDHHAKSRYFESYTTRPSSDSFPNFVIATIRRGHRQSRKLITCTKRRKSKVGVGPVTFSQIKIKADPGLSSREHAILDFDHLHSVEIDGDHVVHSCGHHNISVLDEARVFIPATVLR